MVLVDNSVLSFAIQIENGIPILPYYVNRKDEELLHLIYYLRCLVSQEDVRTHNREAFGLTRLASMDLQQMIRNSASDSMEDNDSYNSSVTAVDRDDTHALDDDRITQLSPTTKLSILKRKYLPSEMEEIDEESVESDLTSSIVSKRLLGLRSKKQKSENKQ